MNSRRRLWIIIIVILIVGIALGLRFCVRQPRAVATYYVSPTGVDGPTRTCAQSTNMGTPRQHLKGANGALACMAGGDTLILLAGTYSELIDTTVDNIPSGTAGANTQLIGSGTAIISFPGGSTGLFGLYMNASKTIGQYVTIQNITFDGGMGGKTANVTGITLNDLIDRDVPPNNNPDHSDQFVTLDNIEVRNFGSNGILIGSGRDRIINSRLHDNGWYDCVPDNPTQCSHTPGLLNYGYNIYYGAGYNGVIDNNEIYNAGRYGMQIYGQLGKNSPPAFVNISKNRVHDNGVLNYGSGIFAGAQNQKIFNNTVYNNKGLDNQSNGIELGDSGTSNILVYNNIVYGNGQDGIRDNNCAIGGYSACTIQNNTVWGNGRYGIETGGSIGDIIQNNAVDSNTAGNIHNTSASGVMYATNFCTTMTAACQFFGNPNFKDITSVPPDLHLTAASTQLIDKGTVNIAVADDDGMTRDIDGEVRTGAFDIGADEFSTGQVSGPGTLQFSASAYSVNENVSGGMVAITITRTAGSTGVVGVDLALSPGSPPATAGSDYTNVSGTYMLGDTVTSLIVNIPIQDDATVEGNEAINLVLSNATGGATLGGLTNAVLTIVDNDVANYVTIDSYPSTPVCDGSSNCDGSRTLTPTRTSIGQIFTVPNSLSVRAGPTYTAATCNLPDVNAAINGPAHTAVDGDIIQIPAGSCTWTAQLIINAAITLQGSGCTLDPTGGWATACNTVIADNLTGPALVTVNLVPNKTTRVTGIQWNDGGRTAGTPFLIAGQGGGGAMDSRRLRLDHNYFNSLNSLIMFQFSHVYGVVDHNKVVGVAGSILFYTYNPSDYDWGNARWNESLASAPLSPTGWGSDQFLFFEDNYLTAGVFTDSYGGERFVARFNTTVGGFYWGTHGTDTSTRVRGTRAIEVYKNHMDTMDPSFTHPQGLMVDQRSGTSLVWGNTGINYYFSAASMTMKSERNLIYGDGFHMIDGSSALDVNAAPSTSCTVSASSIGSAAFSVTCSGVSWSTNQWQGYNWHKSGCIEDQGTGVGHHKVCGGLIDSNDSSSLSGPYFNTGVDNSLTAGDTITIAKVTHGFDQPCRTGGTLPAPTSITSATRSGTTASIILASPGIAGLAAGNWVVVSDVSGLATGYRGTFQVATASDATHFTYVMAADPGASGSDGTVTKIPWTAGANDQVTDSCYEWMNTNNGASVYASGDRYTSQIRQNEHYFVYSGTTQTGPGMPFDGNPVISGNGVGAGAFADRPISCTAGVAYWATNQGSWNTSGSGGQGVLYKCTATNTWTLFYTPYTYPHPLASAVASAPAIGLRQSEFLVSKENAPTGLAVSKLYAITGTPGMDAVPTGPALATSTGVDVSTFPVFTNYALQRFTFPGTPPQLMAGTSYAIVVEYTGANGANDVPLGRDVSAPTHPGNAVEFSSGAWVSESGRDIIFAVYGDTAGSIQLGQSSYTVNENVGSVAITITRTGGATGAVSATFATANGSAMAGSDYTAVSQTVNFANGDSANKTVSITIIDDTAVEGTENFTVSLTNFMGATPGTTTSATVTINDNDAVGPTLAANPTSIGLRGTITATWSGIASPTSTDWIGLYVPGAGEPSYIDWIYVSCSQTASTPRASGSCPFVLPANLTMPGTYELRLFANDGSTLLAMSNPFTVTATTTPTTGFFFGRRR